MKLLMVLPAEPFDLAGPVIVWMMRFGPLVAADLTWLGCDQPQALCRGGVEVG